MCEILESTCRKHKVLCITPTQRVCHFVNLNVCFFLWNSFGYFLGAVYCFFGIFFNVICRIYAFLEKYRTAVRRAHTIYEIIRDLDRDPQERVHRYTPRRPE